MNAKWVLIALVVACSQELVQTHILPPSHVNFPVTECVRSLTRHVINLCSYGDYADMVVDDSMPLIPREEASIRRWELRENIIKTCCTRPCSASELFAIC